MNHFFTQRIARCAPAASVYVLMSVACSAQTYTITTIAGIGSSGYSGDGTSATGAQLSGPSRVALDQSGNLYIADQFNERIRQVSTSGTISSIAGNGTGGYSGDGKGAGSAELNDPFAVVVDSSGNYYIADSSNTVIRKVAGGNISTVAGVYAGGPGYTGDGGAGTNALVNRPTGLALDSAGNLYIADTANNVIRMLSGGNITTVVGNYSLGPAFGGDGGAPTSAALNGPTGIAVDAAGALYIADAGNHRIRKVANGMITTIAGTGRAGFGGDGGPAMLALLNRPIDVAVDKSGNVYIADYFNSRIRKILASGAIETIAGNGRAAYLGDNGAATSASLYFPSGVTVDSSGNVYVADTQNNAIRLLTPVANTALPSINSGGVIGAAAFGGSTSVAPGSWIEIYGSNLASTTRTWAGSDFTGNVAPTSLGGTTVTIGGQLAFISYVSGGQIDAQIPSGIGTGAQAITVANAAGISQAYPITVNTTQAGLFAPSSFKVGGKQYVGALFTDGSTYVLPTGAIGGITSRPAKPGDTIVIYAVGFGAVTPNTPAGQIVQQSNQINAPLQISFGGVAATTTYAGLAPGQVGLYQLNVVVPNVPSGDAVPLTFTLGGAGGTQTLYTAVQD